MNERFSIVFIFSVFLVHVLHDRAGSELDVDDLLVETGSEKDIRVREGNVGGHGGFGCVPEGDKREEEEDGEFHWVRR